MRVKVKVKLVGGLGNQLFQVAFGLSAAKAHEVPLEFGVNDRWPISLGAYRGNASLFDDDSPLLPMNFEGIPRPAWLNPRSTELYYEPAHLRFVNPLTLPLHKILIGYWQNQLYPLFTKETLLKRAADVERSLTLAAKEILRDIKGRESVSIHMRLGDYLEPDANKWFGLCGKAYYEMAVEEMERRLHQRGVAQSRIRYYVFSDSPELAKDLIPLAARSSIVSSEGFAALEDLALMRAAKHNIICNSTFSWWGAWLNASPGKIVIRPTPWYARSDPKILFPKRWVICPKTPEPRPVSPQSNLD